jgi:hypothetical protein
MKRTEILKEAIWNHRWKIMYSAFLAVMLTIVSNSI